MSEKSRRWVRMAGAIWMLAFIAWLPFEDTETWITLLLGTGGCLWLGARWLGGKPSPPASLPNGRGELIKVVAIGALLGAAAPPLAITLMAVKSGLHAHGFGDFTPRQVWEVLRLVPLSAVIGAAVGWATKKLNGRDESKGNYEL